MRSGALPWTRGGFAGVRAVAHPASRAAAMIESVVRFMVLVPRAHEVQGPGLFAGRLRRADGACECAGSAAAAPQGKIRRPGAFAPPAIVVVPACVWQVLQS